jgi:hypothetical protein
VFAVLLYNIWRLTDFLLKADVDGPMDYAPVLTAGECVEIVVSTLIPPTNRLSPAMSAVLEWQHCSAPPESSYYLPLFR